MKRKDQDYCSAIKSALDASCLTGLNPPQEPVGLMLSSILSIEESVERVDSLERSRQLRWIRENS
ncbi:MAG: hypothetical protein ACR2PX_05635 [Endozoicomonas sp.]|uniref:hypothetical protein n=1 Tax=Endozoicomonas sp. TaxID=1892382 RepID=UPI003D9AC643